MGALVYYFSLPFIYLLSLLPFWLLYRFSDVLFVLLYYLIRYRRQVVFTNLNNSFPEKNEEEIRQIARKFYRYFCDLTFESLKTLTIRERTLKKRVSFADISGFEKYFREHRSVIAVMGHIGNWELAGARFSLEPIHQLFVVYHPLRNPHFERLVYHMRTRLGNGLYTMKGTLRGMVRNRGKTTATAFIADQTPSHESVYWMEFLNQDTPVFLGPERIAKKFNYPVIYISVRRPRRGYYAIESEVLFENPGLVPENEITETFTRRLEADIREQPETWLWTHRRWKKKRE